MSWNYEFENVFIFPREIHYKTSVNIFISPLAVVPSAMPSAVLSSCQAELLLTEVINLNQITL